MSRESLIQHLANLKKAEEALALAKERHEEEFRQRLVDLFNEYGLSVEAGGSEGSYLEIHEITHKFTRDMLRW